MSSLNIQNRPLKFGMKDRREFIFENSEVSLVAINDTSGNPIFLGRAKVGELIGEEKWQIRKITYDSDEGVTRVEWPQNDENIATSDYTYIWSSVDDLTITGISQASTAVVTVSALGSLQNGDSIIIQGVSGMTEVNFTGSNIYTVANINSGAGTFELSGINSSGYGMYSSGGTVVYGEVVNYTYS